MNEQRLSQADAAALSASPFTYAPVGVTSALDGPTGYRRSRHMLIVGQGEPRFAEASRRLLGWEMHRRAGVRVEASHAQVVSGAVAVLHWGPGRLGVRAPVRVVRLVDEPRRKGFAYGTLPGHPESGEEAFVVEHRPDGAVVLTVTAVSRPGTVLVRLAGPVGRAVQWWVTRRYLRAL